MKKTSEDPKETANETDEDSPENRHLWLQKVLKEVNTPNGIKSLFEMASEAPEDLMDAAYFVNQVQTIRTIREIFLKAAQSNPVAVYNNLDRIANPEIREDIEKETLRLMAGDV